MKLSNNNQLRFGALLSYVSMIVGFLVQIIYTPIMIRLIGQSQYGLYNLTNSIVNYLSLFSLGFGSAYVRFYMRHKSKNEIDAINKMNGMFMTIFVALGILATVTGIMMVMKSNQILGKKFSNQELVLAKKLMLLMVINIAISFPTIPIVSFIQANEKFIFQNFLNLLRQVLNPFLALPLLLKGYGSLSMIAVTTVISFFVGIWQLIYSFKNLKFKISFRNMDFGELREISVFSFFIFLNAITDQINWNVDKFIIGRYYGSIQVAVYGIAAQLNTYYLSLSTAISNVYIPRINKIVADNLDDMDEKLTKVVTSIGRIQLMIILLALLELIFLGRPFIGFWAGKNYYDAYPILLFLIIPVTIPLIQNAGIAVQQAKNMHVFRSVLYLAIAILNVLLSLLLIKKYGALGTAFATAVSVVLGNGILMNWYYQKHIGLNIKYFWKAMARFVPAVVSTSVVGLISTKFIDTYTVKGFVVSAILIFIIYILTVWKTVLTVDERNVFLVKTGMSRKIRTDVVTVNRKGDRGDDK